MAFGKSARSGAADTAKTSRSVSRTRRRSGGFIIFLAMALIAGLVFVAVRADGREISRTTANDGGAWLVNRGISAVAHRNYASGELSSHIRVTDSPTADVYQSGDLVVVHDAATNQLFEVDTRSFVDDFEPTQLPEFTTVLVANEAVVVMRNEPLAVWRIEQDKLPRLSSLDELEPLVSRDGTGRVAASADGRVAIVDERDRSVMWVAADGTVSEPIDLSYDGSVLDITIVEGSAVVLNSDGDMFVVGQFELEHVVRWQDQSVSAGQPALLQQPSVHVDSFGIVPARNVALVTASGELVEFQLNEERATARNLGEVPGSSPVSPIVHDGCVYGLNTNPPNFGVACDGITSQALDGAGPNLRLRLVNGWVLVNDVDSGTTFATDENLNFRTFDEWGRAQEVVEEDAIEEDTGNSENLDPDGPLEDDPDAEGSVQDSDDFNASEANVPPEAVDDIARTRVDRSVVVDVLENDRDLNNDILVVTDVELLSGEAAVVKTPSGSAIQVTPGAGFSGTVELRYFITDGKSEPVSALVIVEVVSRDTANRPPIAVTDIIATAPGHTTTVDVLRNDSDPDGDAIALAGVEAPSGTVRWDPIGQVTFTPDLTTTAGWLELPYIVQDDLGLEAEGLLRVEIRDDGANQEPDARNDQATTVVGRTVVINLLANDSDPDGDTLILGSQPRLLEPAGATPQWQATSDGEFVFRSDVAGTFLFSYTANDAAATGGESDTAQIRVDVLPATGNQPPVAVRDDVVIAAGETRLVNVLANDGDPDGDLVSIVDWQHSDSIDVTEYNDGTGVVGFQITVQPGSVVQPTMSYSISDGFNQPVSAPVVIAVVQRAASDQPPFANDDVIEARAGSAVNGVKVLRNDFDPEGGALRIVGTGASASAQVQISEDEQSIDLVIADDVVSSFSIPYDIEDLGGNRAAAVLRVQLINPNAPNRPPVARADDARTNQGEPILINVLANDSDPDSDIILLEAISDQPTNGTAEVVDGLVRYAPDVGFSGTDIFRYEIVDTGGGRAVGDIFVGVREDPDANRPPIANDDSYTLAGVPSKTPLDVLSNDSDPDNDPLRVVSTSRPTLGSVDVDDFGRVAYEPPPSLAEDTTVTFNYVIVDTAQNTAQATVSIQMSAYERSAFEDPIFPEPTPQPETTPEPTPEATPTPLPTPAPQDRPNVPPIAVNDRVGPVRAGTTVEVPVLDNDRDPDGEPGGLTIVQVDSGARVDGDLVVIEAGEETMQVQYRIEDVDGASSTATITVLVIGNKGPTVNPLSVTTPFETPIDLDMSGESVDPDDDPLFFVCCEGIRGGSITDVVTSSGRFQLTFVPDPEFIGAAGFNYVVDDQKGHQVAGSVAIQVLDPGNRVPATISDSVTIPQGESAQVDLSSLTTDPDNDPLLYTLESEPGGLIAVQITGATATVSSDREVAVGPAGDFVYRVSDGELTTTGTISITVTEGANRPPVAGNFSIDVPAAGSDTVDLASLTSDPDPGDPITYSLEGDLGSAISQITLSGSVLEIRSPASAIGERVTINYLATDSRGGTDQAQVTLDVVAPESPEPAVTDDQATAERNAAVTVDVLANDADPLGEGLTIVDDLSPPWGTTTIVGNQLQFNPGDRVGEVRINYTIRDEANREATGRLVVEVVGAPDQPSPPDVTRGSREVQITWDEPASNGRPIDGYRIFSSEHTDPEVIGRQNFFTWSGLENGIEHTFWVVAFNSVDDSLPSDPSQPVTPDQLPEPPGPPRVIRGDEELTLEWDPATTEGTEVDRYEVAISPSTGRPPQPASGELSHTWEGLDNGSTYTFTVRAHNDAGWSEPSASSPEGTPSAPPDQLSIGTTTRGSQSGALTVNWSNNGTNGAAITRYEVRSSAITDPVPEPDGNARSYTWSSLDNGVDMTFAVRGWNEAGWSVWSDESNEMQACGVPEPSTNVVAVRGDRTASVTWTGPTNTVTCQVTNYIVEAIVDGQVVQTRNSANASRNFTGLENGDSHTFRVRATNSIGTGGSSAESLPVTPAGPPICPRNTASFTSSVTAPRSVNLNWSSLAAANGEGITDYEIDRKNGAGYVSVGGPIEAITYSSGLDNGQTYNFDIRARNVVGVSGRCLSTSATMWALPDAISATQDFDGETELLSVTVSGGDANGVPGGTRTIALYLNGSELVSAVPVSNAGHTFPITTDGTYRAVLEACNAAGCVTGQSADLPIVLASEPATMTAANIQLSTFNNTNVYDADPGMELSVTIIPPANNGSDIFEYVTEVAWSGSSGTWHLVTTDTADVSATPNSPFTINDAYTYPGYSSHPRGRNWAERLNFRVRSRAENGKGVGDWSDWIVVSPVPPPPRVSFSVRNYWSCGPTQTYPPQCHEITVEMYGFEPSRNYGLRSPASTDPTTGHWEFRNGTTNPPGDNMFGFFCSSAGVFEWGVRTDANGIVAGEDVLCTSTLNSDVRINTGDGYFTPWRPPG